MIHLPSANRAGRFSKSIGYIVKGLTEGKKIKLCSIDPTYTDRVIQKISEVGMTVERDETDTDVIFLSKPL